MVVRIHQAGKHALGNPEHRNAAECTDSRLTPIRRDIGSSREREQTYNESRLTTRADLEREPRRRCRMRRQIRDPGTSARLEGVVRTFFVISRDLITSSAVFSSSLDE